MKQTKLFCDICGEEILPDDFKEEGEVKIVGSTRIIISSTDSDSPVIETIFIDGIGSPDYKVHTCYRCLLGTAIFMTNEKKTVFAKYINDCVNNALIKYSKKKHLNKKDEKTDTVTHYPVTDRCEVKYE
jgi:hypothetical protein